MKLYLDDVRPKPRDYDFLAKTAKEAIDLLKTGKITCISFDHDLGEESNGTGYDVASWIEHEAYKGKIKSIDWVVHSANPVGRNKIQWAMESAQRWMNEESSSDVWD